MPGLQGHNSTVQEESEGDICIEIRIMSRDFPEAWSKKASHSHISKFDGVGFSGIRKLLEENNLVKSYLLRGQIVS